MGNIESCLSDKNIREETSKPSKELKPKHSLLSTKNESRSAQYRSAKFFKEDLSESMNEYSFLNLKPGMHNHSISFLDKDVEDLSPIEDSANE